MQIVLSKGVIFFFADGIEDPSTTISGPSSSRLQNAIYMTFCWLADGGPTLVAL